MVKVHAGGQIAQSSVLCNKISVGRQSWAEKYLEFQLSVKEVVLTKFVAQC